MIKNKLNKELYNFYIFILGQFVSQFGSKLTSFGLGLWAFKETGSVLSTALISLSYVVPEVLLSFISGSISDSWNKKKIMLIADSIAAGFSFGVILMIFTGTLRLEYIYLINVVLGVTDSFQNPAAEVTISLIVPKDQYVRTSGIRSFCTAFTGIAPPVVATSLYAFCGLKIIVIIDLVTFIFAFISLAVYVKIPHNRVQTDSSINLMEQCKFGIRYLFDNKGIFKLIMFMAFVNLISSIYNTILQPMVLLRNGDNDIQLGIVTSMVSVAGLIGSLLVSRVQKTTKRVPLILNIMSFSFLICNGLLGIGRNYYVWTFAVFAGNLFIPILLANVEYIMRTKIPIEHQGKVFSARNTLQYASIPAGKLLAGVLSDKVYVPFMAGDSFLRDFCALLVGDGAGGGIALLYLCIAFIGVAGCSIFRRDKKLMSLDI
ncbi:MAG: hypothetical protein K0R00_1993 [Herbinix sp.]|jgi:Na+/melibiose symporter-like transporter|nr:hypothetical protein [Herbinix sp.]